LEWDSEYFQYPTYRIEFWESTESMGDESVALHNALLALKKDLRDTVGRYYLWSEVPATDTVLLQALGLARFRLIETRLGFWLENLQDFNTSQRWPVRKAILQDIAELRRVAAVARNPFDRFHADRFFTETVADAFLATYAENSIRGLADIVLVPDPGDPEPPGAFMTGKLFAAAAQVRRCGGQIMLAAVAPERKGWHRKLMEEIAHWFKHEGSDFLYMVTQATNGAVIRNSERLGFRLAKTSHVFATFQ
jgi:dTDP-4-amino-4,6-dideoxy-D-galactose acyltransferase